MKEAQAYNNLQRRNNEEKSITLYWIKIQIQTLAQFQIAIAVNPDI
jgi:hypothetical protein